jgi:ABC-type transporter Mla subunit MlaD
MTRVRYLIGVATLVAAIIGGYLLFDLLRRSDRSDMFALRVEFRDALGLRAGADVRFRGVPRSPVSPAFSQISRSTAPSASQRS